MENFHSVTDSLVVDIHQLYKYLKCQKNFDQYYTYMWSCFKKYVEFLKDSQKGAKLQKCST